MNIEEAIKATELNDLTQTQYNKIIASLSGCTIKEAHEATKVAGVFASRNSAVAAANKAELEAYRATPEYAAGVAFDLRNAKKLIDGGTALRRFGKGDR